MAAPAHMAAAMTSAELIAVLTWWFVLLAGAAMLARRLQQRSTGALRRLLRRRDPGSCRSRLETQPPEATVPAGYATRRPASLSRQQPVLAAATLGPLCRYVDFHRRLEVATTELVARLGELPGDRWRIEPYPLTGERRNTLLVLGETGVFVISATYASGHWDDVVTVHKLADKIQLLLPGYGGAVQAAICHPFTSGPRACGTAPTIKATGSPPGCSAATRSSSGFITSAENGLSRGDLERFDWLAKPNW